MQGLADGYFVIPYTVGHYIASNSMPKVRNDHPAFLEAEKNVQANIDKLLEVGKKGKKTVNDFYRELGKLMWDEVGMARSEEGLKKTLKALPELRKEFWSGFSLQGTGDELNKNLEMAGRVADFLELGELMARDALNRKESCGGHFRVESQTPEGEAQRDDANFSYVAAWEFQGVDKEPVLHKEPLTFDNVHLAQRSYK
jgi:succinate dehydrogenase / fumarate reductase flavoprotein subunit